MEALIDDLLGSYETGVLSRRALVGALAALTVTKGAASAAPAGFEVSGINHVNLAVADPQRSVEFYQRVFRLPPPTNAAGGVLQLSVGKAQHISIVRATAAKGIDHFAVGIERFNKDSVVADLRARGVTPLEMGSAGLHVVDPDGINVQLSANQAG